MQVAILAGGLATRLGDLARNRPKSLIEVAGKSFLAYQLDFLRKAGVTEVVLCIGHLSEQIRRRFGDGTEFGVHITYSVEKELLGTAGALRKAEPLLSDLFFTLYGDSYVFLDFDRVFQYFGSKRKLALMTVLKNYDRHDRSNTAVEGNLVSHYNKEARYDDMVYIDYGVCLFRKEALTMVPEDRTHSLEKLFSQLVEMRELLAYEVKERFYQIGSPKGLREFEEYVGGKK
jgi:NDP-sugar pyrophosphorylase family protein